MEAQIILVFARPSDQIFWESRGKLGTVQNTSIEGKSGKRWGFLQVSLQSQLGKSLGEYQAISGILSFKIYTKVSTKRFIQMRLLNNL